VDKCFWNKAADRGRTFFVQKPRLKEDAVQFPLLCRTISAMYLGSTAFIHNLGSSGMQTPELFLDALVGESDVNLSRTQAIMAKQHLY
jgi:hypothetical protein